MRLRFGKNNRYGERMPGETAWKILIGIIILLAATLIAKHFGILI